MDDAITHHFMEDLMPMIVLPAMTFALAWVISQIIGAFKHRARLRAQTELHNKMLDKFGSAEEFTAYLKSDAGQNFFEKLSVEPAAPLTKILGSIQRGVILALLGLGFFVLNNVFDTQDSRSIMLIIATVSLTIGLGFLISSGISYRLAKAWGMISTGNARAETETKTAAS